MAVIAALLVALTAVGCGSADEPSASDAIPAPTVEITLEEDLRLGTDDPLFGYIGDVKADEAGNVFIVESPNPANVYKFSPNGELLTKIGAQGEGPGEYRYPSPIIIRPDSLVIWDAYNNKFLVYEPDGTPRHTGDRMVAGDRTFLSVEGEFEGEYFMVESPYFMPGKQDEEQGEVKYRILDSNLVLGEPLWSAKMQEFLVNSTPNMISVMQRPFGRATLCANTLDRFYCTWSESIVLSGFTADGDTLPPLSVEYEPVAISASAGQEAIEDVDEDFRSRVVLPKTHPALSGVTGDDRGLLWIKVFTSEDESQTDYWIVDTAARSVVSAHVDDNMEILSVKDNHAYARLTTPEGELLVVRYRIHE